VVGGAKRAPRLELRGRARELGDRVGVRAVHLSISHDAGVAAAVVVLEGEPTGEAWP
jgi:holo-[acyl-carrier protein] synthase